LSGDTVHVIAGVLIGRDGRVLIAQRPVGKHLAGGWEFPGGKLGTGEDRETGLRRELLEEIGIQVRRCRPLIRLHHAYSDRKILLDVWLVDSFVGEPQSLDGQCLRWCTRDELREVQLLAADLPVVTALRLPAVIESSAGPDFDILPIEAYASPAQHAGRSPQGRLIGVMCGSEAQARDAAAAGADFIALSRDIPAADLRRCCERIGRPVYAGGISLREAWELGAAGVIALTGSDRKTV
jgi:mutator protein MutT